MSRHSRASRSTRQRHSTVMKVLSCQIHWASIRLKVDLMMKRNLIMRSMTCLSFSVLIGLGSLLLACGGGARTVTGEAADGQKIFNANCALCHGQGGVGKPALGKDLRQNAFVAGLTDEEAVGVPQGRAPRQSSPERKRCGYASPGR